jgi:acetyl-CoA carboxylase carboxyl transferase subunit beta
VIEDTIREKLPEGFQRSEHLLEHGMIDMVVKRHDLRDTLARTISLLRNTSAPAQIVELAQPATPAS